MDYGYKPTTNGRALLAACLSEEKPLKLTRVAVGSGAVPEGTDLADIHQLIQPVAEGTIGERRHEGDSLYLTVQYDNSGSPDVGAFFLSEFMVYAQDPESGQETDLLYATLGDYRQPVPAYNPALPPSVWKFPLVLVVSDQIQVSVTAPAGLVTYDDFDKTLDQRLKDKADLVDGQVPYEQIPHLANNVTLYVDAATGDDANDGSQEMPFKTIQAAINSLPQLLIGAVTINVAAGTYEENVSFYGFAGGKNAYMGINLQGAGQDQTFIKGLVITQTTIPVWFSNLHISKGNQYGMCGTYFNTAIFENVTFDAADAVREDLSACISVFGGMTHFANCTFKNSPMAAIQCAGFVSGYKLTGEHNQIGILASVSPGVGAFVTVDAIPEGFATIKYKKDYGNAVIFEGGVQV